LKDSVILVGQDSFSEAQLFFNKFQNEKIFILVDVNSKKYCLDIFISFFSSLKKAFILEIKAGESFKSISTLNFLTNQFPSLFQKLSNVLVSCSKIIDQGLSATVLA